jgi:hypothetical protein
VLTNEGLATIHRWSILIKEQLQNTARSLVMSLRELYHLVQQVLSALKLASLVAESSSPTSRQIAEVKISVIQLEHCIQAKFSVESCSTDVVDRKRMRTEN